MSTWKVVVADIVMLLPFYFLIPWVAGAQITLPLMLTIMGFDLMVFLHTKIFH